MSDTTSTLTWLLKDQVSGPAHKIDATLDETGKTAGRSGGLLGGLGDRLGGLVNPMTLAVGGATALVGFLGMAGKAAADEEKNIAKLDAALVASIPGWDGNRDAIEAVIEQRENLAFADDELRDSLGTLVVATGSVTEAQDLQATAMDLARLKGVSLQTASEALAKANQGSTRELKALGLTIDEGASKTQILTQIQKAAAGQAAAYASTTSAKWEILTNKFGNVVETIGGAVLPIIESLVDFLVTTVIPAVSGLANIVGPILGGAFDVMGKAIGFAIDHFVKPAIDLVKTLIGWVHDALKFLGILQDEPIPQPTGGGFNEERGRAAGGPVEPGTAYRVGEYGPETLVMGAQGGTIIPAGTSGGGGLVPVEIPIVIDGREIGRIVDARLFLALDGAGQSMMTR